VRWAPSGVFDAMGRQRGWMTAIDDNDGVLMAQVPVGQRPTIATSLGHVPVWVALAALLILVLAAIRPSHGVFR